MTTRDDKKHKRFFEKTTRGDEDLSSSFPLISLPGPFLRMRPCLRLVILIAFIVEINTLGSRTGTSCPRVARKRVTYKFTPMPGIREGLIKMNKMGYEGIKGGSVTGIAIDPASRRQQTVYFILTSVAVCHLLNDMMGRR